MTLCPENPTSYFKTEKLDFDEYIEKNNLPYTKDSWIDWKMDVEGADYMTALRESQDLEL